MQMNQFLRTEIGSYFQISKKSANMQLICKSAKNVQACNFQLSLKTIELMVTAVNLLLQNIVGHNQEELLGCVYYYCNSIESFVRTRSFFDRSGPLEDILQSY